MGALRSAPTGSSNTNPSNIRLRVPSRSYSEPWGIHPMGALRSAPTGSSNTNPYNIRLRVPSTSYSEPWGLHPMGALRSAPTTIQDSEYLQEATRSLGGYIQWAKDLHKYLRAFWSSSSQHQRSARVNKVQSLRLSPKIP